VADPRVMLIKGYARSDPPLSPPKWIEVTQGGRKVKRGVQVWSVGVDWFKDELSGFLRLPKPEDGQSCPGYCHFPHYARDHFDQLTAEEKVVERTRNGFQRHVWRKVRPRNETLDCRIYPRRRDGAEARRLPPARLGDDGGAPGPRPRRRFRLIHQSIRPSGVPEVVDQPEPAFRVPSPRAAGAAGGRSRRAA
jgi:hypothetical protein